MADGEQLCQNHCCSCCSPIPPLPSHGSCDAAEQNSLAPKKRAATQEDTRYALGNETVGADYSVQWDLTCSIAWPPGGQRHQEGPEHGLSPFLAKLRIGLFCVLQQRNRLFQYAFWVFQFNLKQSARGRDRLSRATRASLALILQKL